MNKLTHFQNRDEAIAAFDRLWDAPAPWILAFTGFSGQGKSTLLDWFEANRCQRQNIPYALIGVGEFSGQIREAFHALLESHTANLRLHLPPVTLQTYETERRRLLNQHNQRPVSLQQSQTMAGSEEGAQTMSANLAEVYRQLDAETDKLILDAWLDCFKELDQAERVVLLLDNYDSFQDGAAVEDLQHFWQRMSQAKAKVPGLRVLLACRESLRHENKLRVFENGLVRDNLQPLSTKYSDALMQRMGVTDPAYRQAVFTRLAHGHPLLTRMAAEAWQKEVRLNKGGIAAADVPRLNSHEEAVRWVQGRILDRLDGPLQKAARWSALLRWFNMETLAAIFDKPLSQVDFRVLISYAFIIRPRLTPFGLHGWACHDLVRRVQSSYLRQEQPAAFRAFHQKARDYFLSQNEPMESLYHHFFTDPTAAFAEWQARESRAAFAFDHAHWSALMEMGLSTEIGLTPEQQAEVWYRAGRRHYYRAEWDLADESYGQALERFNAIGDRLGQANVLLSNGKLHLQQADRASRQAGAEMLEQSLTLYRHIGDRVGQTNIYTFYAQWLAGQGQIKEALGFANQSLQLALSFAPGHPVTEWLAGFVQSLAAQESGTTAPDHE